MALDCWGRGLRREMGVMLEGVVAAVWEEALEGRPSHLKSDGKPDVF